MEKLIPLSTGTDRPIEKFKDQFPAFDNNYLDLINRTQFSRMRGIYADTTGAAIAPQFLMETHFHQLCKTLLGNPHSINHLSNEASDLIEKTRNKILSHLKTSSDEYTLIFTAGTTASLRLIEECYSFKNGHLALLQVNHNSMNMLREKAKRDGNYSTVKVNPDLEIIPDSMLKNLNIKAKGNRLLAYPAASNADGNLHSLHWIEQAHKRGFDVLLDAAAFLPSNPLDLGKVKPDFVAFSCYKLFGYPTGIGCLVVKNTHMPKLVKSSFSGGTIQFVTVLADNYVLQDGYARFEDGTVNFLSIPALNEGFEFLKKVGIESISYRTKSLASYLYDELDQLYYNNGQKAVMLYGSKDKGQRGCLVSFNVMSPNGIPIDHGLISMEADRNNIYVREGCFCNPGAFEITFGLEKKQIQAFLDSKQPPTIQGVKPFIGNSPVGAVRCSFGFHNTPQDVITIADFVKDFVHKTEIGEYTEDMQVSEKICV